MSVAKREIFLEQQKEARIRELELVNLTEAQNGWKSVEEELPEKFGLYIIFDHWNQDGESIGYGMSLFHPGSMSLSPKGAFAGHSPFFTPTHWLDFPPCSFPEPEEGKE